MIPRETVVERRKYPERVTPHLVVLDVSVNGGSERTLEECVTVAPRRVRRARVSGHRQSKNAAVSDARSRRGAVPADSNAPVFPPVTRRIPHLRGLPVASPATQRPRPTPHTAARPSPCCLRAAHAYARRYSDASPRPLCGHAGRISRPAFSPERHPMTYFTPPNCIFLSLDI